MVAEKYSRVAVLTLSLAISMKSRVRMKSMRNGRRARARRKVDSHLPPSALLDACHHRCLLAMHTIRRVKDLNESLVSFGQQVSRRPRRGKEPASHFRA